MQYLRLKTEDQRNGPGYRKFNSSLISDETYRARVKDVIKKCKNDWVKVQLSKEITWEMCKRRIKEYTIEYCKMKSKIKNKMS